MSLDETTDGAVVATSHGRVQGVLRNGINIFRGIPYGAPTSGANRFRAPQPVAPWAGVREARLYGETAPQMRSWLAEGGFDGNKPEIGEDCLVLNVWTPAVGDAARRPVMVWLHGGGFEAGTGSVLLYDGANVARRGDVVVVTINHRLGLTGHLHLADIAGEDFAGSANAGFLDVIAALQWVRTNIESFGGDADNVMVYGQSGGGRKVSLLTAAPSARGLFHKGVVQSGSHLRLVEREKANAMAEQLLAHLEIPVTDVRRLEELPLKVLLRAQRELRKRFSPTIDGVVFDQHPWDPDAPATAADVPMMIGTCRTELSNQLGLMDPSSFDITDAELPERLARFIPTEDAEEAARLVRADVPGASAPEVLFTVASARGYWLDSVLQTERRAALSATGAPVWSYRLMWRTPVEGGRRITPHSLDLSFVFDNVELGKHMVGVASEQTALMANAMAESWIAFARSGDPNNAAIPQWDPYDLERRAVLHFDVPCVAVDDPHRAEREFYCRYPTQQAGRWTNPAAS